MVLRQESVEVPDPPATLGGLRLQTRLVELVATASVTVPVKPFTGVTVTVEVAVVPVLALTLVGLEVKPKSWFELCSRHAVRGWSSQPLKLCHDSPRCAGSQKTKP